VSDKAADFQEAKKLAVHIKESLRERTELTCSIGIAANKMLAKMASDMDKPDGLMIINPQNAKSMIGAMDVNAIPKIGPKTKSHLQMLGVKSVGDLAKVDLFKLIEEFGKKAATYMHDAANGIDYEPVVNRHQRNQISRIKTLKTDLTESSQMQNDLYELCQSVHEKLITNKLFFKTATIILILDNLDNLSRSKSLRLHSDDLEILHSTAKSLLKDAIIQMPAERKIRRLGIKLSTLTNSIGQNTIAQFMTGER
jgi:DNA polymerase IV (DinB-like DNA polymerase)